MTSGNPSLKSVKYYLRGYIGMTATTKDAAPEDMSLEWIQMRTEMYKMQPETFGEKSVRKFKENPLVPVGMYLVDWAGIGICC